MNFGQTCHAGTRIYVHESVYDEFVKAYVDRLKKVKVGDNFDTDVDQGPQNSKIQYEKILGYIESGKSEGATIALGGNATKQDGGKGYFIEPTIFTDVKPNMKIMREEIFGPVVAIASFKDEEEVIELANDTSYGLAAGIHTKDYERAIRVTNQLQAGTTWVNMYNFVHWSIVSYFPSRDVRRADMMTAIRWLQGVRYRPRVWCRCSRELHRSQGSVLQHGSVSTRCYSGDCSAVSAWLVAVYENRT